MTDPINFFEPYESLPPQHENQLTRALLVVLRYCPIAHQAWLSMVDPARKIHQLPHPAFGTQRARILGEGSPGPTNAPIPGISVICAADPPAPGEVAEASDRAQVLDGIIRYSNDLVIVIESKLDGPASDRQAREINLHGQPVEFDGRVRAVSWRSILEAFDDLASDERGVTGGAERTVLRDFLDFVYRNFPRLGPFSTLDRCKGEPSRVMHRLRAVAREATGGDPVGDGAVLPGHHQAVVSAHSGYQGEGEKRRVVLKMYPADTLEQARALYMRPGACRNVLALESRGWSVSPKFHFGFMAKGLCWTRASAHVADYVRYWQEHIGKTRQIDRADWPAFWERLERLGFAQDADREQFDRDFTATGRGFASPRPGLACVYSWALAEAERSDGRGTFVPDVRDRINELLRAVEEPELS